ncbi:MAG TPA: DUF255 domain-containing protein [Chitinivibrionales bacterium]
MIYTQNNLRFANSPYLQQHKNNPIWWQEWGTEVLEYAVKSERIVFASIGYATCHWCHVMAKEAFSDKQVSGFLNSYFVSIKVDREQRPDIDQFAMAFINSLGRQGGWPLNIFFTPSLKPIVAFTYMPVGHRDETHGFLEVLHDIKKYYDKHGSAIEPFMYSRPTIAQVNEEQLAKKLSLLFDFEHGGFGDQEKFPPHCIVLFMLYYFEVNKDPLLKKMISSTLDTMLLSGLHDHLQGGFFRYCVDQTWTIPHFEKMLYDQALLLWEYSLAYGIFKNENYKRAAQKIIQCLEETFESDGLYYSGHDADTDHEEGATYTWSQDEIASLLPLKEFLRFNEVYGVSKEGNFKGENHLVKIANQNVAESERILLGARKMRPQPFVDRKIITSWNCLAGIGFIHAYRYLKDDRLLAKARSIFSGLMDHNWRMGTMHHSSMDSNVLPGEYLQDCGAMLLFITYLHEETGEFSKEMDAFYGKVKEYHGNDEWMESSQKDFLTVPAEPYDSPVPSGASMAELAMARADILQGRQYDFTDFREPLLRDFFNISVLLRNGFFHCMKTPSKIDYNRLPGNTVQVRSHECVDCYLNVCIPKEELCLEKTALM